MLARRIAPSIVRIEGFDPVRPDQPGTPLAPEIKLKSGGNPEPARGLALRDLIRCCSVPMATVDAIIGQMERNSTFATEIKKHPILRSAQERTKAMGKWLDDSSVEFKPEDRKFLSEHPPLLFFILFEAEQIHDGKCLGPVGSFIVAETTCGALSVPVQRSKRRQTKRRTYAPALEKEPTGCARIFPKHGALPTKMYDLIQFVEKPFP
jgi:hypothetical protein